MQANPLQRAINLIGMPKVASVCGVSYQAVQSWLKRGLPSTEWTRETVYAEEIQFNTLGKVSRKSLLDWSLRQRGKKGGLK